VPRPAPPAPASPAAAASQPPRWLLTKPLRARIEAGHPWIFDRALAPPRGLALGALATIADERGPIAIAFADPTSPIRARVLAPPGTVIDAAWVRDRVAEAASCRARDPLLIDCTGRRLVHGEADGCPGLVVDAYADTAVVALDGAAAAAFWRPYTSAILSGLERGGAAVAHAWLRGARRREAAAGSALTAEALRGAPPAEIVITEDDARFAVDVRAGQKTGFFLDQRENRRLVRRHAAGATVLNVFAYTGGFSLHALLGGAARVTSVDLAAPAMRGLERNLALSGLASAAHEAVTADAFELLARAATQGRRWELVIVDPPSFAPSERARPAALAAYRKLAAAALAVVEPGGRLALASCSSHVTEADLLATTHGLRPLRVRASLGAASDHPLLPAFPEGRYLKFLLFDVT
jgi:23S rRNA (cytosine1962-C5)-methyltransferase